MLNLMLIDITTKMLFIPEWILIRFFKTGSWSESTCFVLWKFSKKNRMINTYLVGPGFLPLAVNKTI